MANLLRGVIILLTSCGLYVHLWLLPNVWNNIFFATKEWIVLVCVAIIPCYAAMVMAWLITNSIAKEEEFTKRNAVLFRWIGILAICDSGIFMLLTVLLVILQRALIWNLFAAIPLTAAGICIAICAAVLSRLVGKAAELKEDSDLTI